MEKIYNYLYKITNQVNGKFYYGIHSTNNLNDGYFGSGSYLNRSIKKWGKKNFKKEILEFSETRTEISDLEKKIVTLSFIQNPLTYNIRLGGDNGMTIGTVSIFLNGSYIRVPKNQLPNDFRYPSTGVVSTYSLLDKKYIQVTKDEYYLNKGTIYFHNAMDKFPAYDSLIKENVMVDKHVYNENKDRYIPHNKGKVIAYNEEGKMVHISKDEYVTGTYKTYWNGRTHSSETKEKISSKLRNKNKGEKNGSFGTVWVTKNQENKKIQKDQLNSYLDKGWKTGRHLTTPSYSKLSLPLIMEDIKENLTNTEIAKKYGVGISTLKRFLKDNKIKR